MLVNELKQVLEAVVCLNSELDSDDDPNELELESETAISVEAQTSESQNSDRSSMWDHSHSGDRSRSTISINTDPSEEDCYSEDLNLRKLTPCQLVLEDTKEDQFQDEVIVSF